MSSTTQRRTNQEDDKRAQEDRFASKQVGELAVNGYSNGHGQQIDGRDPGDQVKSLQVSADTRQGSAHNGLIQRGDKRHQHGTHQGKSDGARGKLGYLRRSHLRLRCRSVVIK